MIPGDWSDHAVQTIRFKGGCFNPHRKQVDIFLVQLSTDVRLENAETHSARDSSAVTVRRLEF